MQYKCKKCHDVSSKPMKDGLCDTCRGKKSEGTFLFGEEMAYVYTPPEGLGPNPYLGSCSHDEFQQKKKKLAESTIFLKEDIAQVVNPGPNTPYDHLDNPELALYRHVRNKTGLALDIQYTGRQISDELMDKYGVSAEDVSRKAWTVTDSKGKPPVVAITRVADDDDDAFEDVFYIITRETNIWNRQHPNYILVVAQNDNRLSHNTRLVQMDIETLIQRLGLPTLDYNRLNVL